MNPGHVAWVQRGDYCRDHCCTIRRADLDSQDLGGGRKALCLYFNAPSIFRGGFRGPVHKMSKVCHPLMWNPERQSPVGTFAQDTRQRVMTASHPTHHSCGFAWDISLHYFLFSSSSVTWTCTKCNVLDQMPTRHQREKLSLYTQGAPSNSRGRRGCYLHASFTDEETEARRA